MLFTYRNHPVLERLKHSDLTRPDFFLHPNEAAWWVRNEKDSAKKLWKTYCKYFSSKIRAVSSPFHEAMLKAQDKLLTDEMRESISNESGTFIFGKWSYCYFIKDRQHCIFIFYDNALMLQSHTNKQGNTEYWLSENICPVLSKEQKVDVFGNYVSIVLLYINFLKYAPIEVKYLSANKRINDINCKYVNQTDLNIEVINSSWFTTLVKSDAFKVRGHFRLQPCGPGLKDKKLIWISEFEKQGYVRNFKRPVNIDD